ncbi:hypothetical protein O181_117731 [Austropuccinia psidii MF-1]|uniref:Uncharacterized protein n=1 Tax=Austropuccinia psidii MF-1 TaxID=1389203 RepID=A0A9Q3PY71_9BASI|nr:hypothetical protein [Austropuccinia psidii MF-1]
MSESQHSQWAYTLTMKKFKSHPPFSLSHVMEPHLILIGGDHSSLGIREEMVEEVSEMKYGCEKIAEQILASAPWPYTKFTLLHCGLIISTTYHDYTPATPSPVIKLPFLF